MGRAPPACVFENYLSSRRQRVRGGTSVESLTAGVPQDSLTDPILFLLNTNNIGTISPELQDHQLCRRQPNLVAQQNF